jgi:hypothetical protein
VELLFQGAMSVELTLKAWDSGRVRTNGYGGGRQTRQFLQPVGNLTETCRQQRSFSALSIIIFFANMTI